MALPRGTTGSLSPSFDPARLVSLTVKPASAIALPVRLPTVLSGPLQASDTLLEATTPVKLPTIHGPLLRRVSRQSTRGWYFNVDSTNTSVPASKSPTYPTHYLLKVNTKL